MKIECLEGRQLLSASISGTIYYDSDVSQTQDAREPSMAGVTVYLDKNVDGKFDAGDATAVTDRLGRYTFKRLTGGDYIVGVVAPSGDVQTTPGRLGAVRGRFQIVLNLQAGITAVERAAFAEAARRWESVISAEPATTDRHAVNNLLTIDAAVKPIDGIDGTLAESNPTAFRSDDDLPTRGGMTFDRDDMQSLEASGMLQDTILHEMAHVLGFGTIWDDLGLIANENSHHPRFTGAAATAAYDTLFNVTTPYVPVDGTGGDGTAGGHWDSDVFGEELMTGYAADPGVTVPLSSVTVAQFADLGYTVNPDAADQWNPSRHRTIKTTPLDLGTKAFERRVSVTSSDSATNLSFGYRADTAPSLRMNVTSATGNAGAAVLLSAAKVIDAEGDGISGVSFYRETNNTPGLQIGAGGDTFIATRTISKRGVFQVSAPSNSVAGTNTYYASVSDDLGFSRRRSVAIDLTTPAPPARPRALAATSTADGSLSLQWRAATGASAYRIEISTDAGFSSTALVKAFNIAAPTTSTFVQDLTLGETYYTRVRAYNATGISAYTLAEPLTLT